MSKKKEIELPNLSGRRTRIDVPEDYIKLVFLSDTHFGSKYCAQDKINLAIDEINRYKPDAIFFGGDIVDGNHVYQGHEFELEDLSLPEQLESAQIMDRIKGKVYAIEGNHDLSWVKKGAGYPVKMFCEDKSNWDYAGAYYGGYKLVTPSGQDLTIDIMHPNGGGAYAISYAAQKVMRNLPHTTDVLALGHFHQTGYFQIPDNGRYTHAMMVPSFQAPTPYAQRMGHIFSYIGYVSVELKLVQNKIKDFVFKLNEML